MPKVSLEQKRLESLRRQLYGGPQKVKTVQKVQVKSETGISIDLSHINEGIQISSGMKNNTETVYLSQDLKKIFVLSSIALGVQLLLYLSLKMNLIHLGF